MPPDRTRAQLLAVLGGEPAPDPRGHGLPFPAIVVNARCPGCGVVWDYDEDGDGYGVWDTNGILWCSVECYVRRYRKISAAVRSAVAAFLTDTTHGGDTAVATGCMRNAIMAAVFPPGKATGDGGSAQ